jgi:hypothetical protein
LQALVILAPEFRSFKSLSLKEENLGPSRTILERGPYL